MAYRIPDRCLPVRYCVVPGGSPNLAVLRLSTCLPQSHKVPGPHVTKGQGLWQRAHLAHQDHHHTGEVVVPFAPPNDGSDPTSAVELDYSSDAGLSAI